MKKSTRGFIYSVVNSMNDVTLRSMLDRNKEIAAQHHRNANRMDEIVEVMEEVFRKRGLQ